MRICIIGSMSCAETIRSIAYEFKDKNYYEVWYAKPSEEPLEKRICDAFEEIRNADTVIVVRNPDGTIGVGTLYEKVYAETLDKEVVILGYRRK